MSHPQVAEAVAFGCPDEKYGEIVAAAVVPHKPVSDTAAFAKDLQKQAGEKMAAFKVQDHEHLLVLLLPRHPVKHASVSPQKACC